MSNTDAPAAAASATSEPPLPASVATRSSTALRRRPTRAARPTSDVRHALGERAAASSAPPAGTGGRAGRSPRSIADSVTTISGSSYGCAARAAATTRRRRRGLAHHLEPDLLGRGALSDRCRPAGSVPDRARTSRCPSAENAQPRYSPIRPAPGGGHRLHDARARRRRGRRRSRARRAGVPRSSGIGGRRARRRAASASAPAGARSRFVWHATSAMPMRGGLERDARGSPGVSDGGRLEEGGVVGERATFAPCAAAQRQRLGASGRA